MNLRDIDLNLLVVFDAIAEHSSVTKAADMLGLSQPATSAALKRLRTLLGDPLFVKAADTMKPTPRAQQLVTPIRHILDVVRGEVLSVATFDPATSERQFTLLTPDIGEINFLPPLLSFLSEAGSTGVRIKTLSLPRHTAAEALEAGSADIALGYFPDLQKGAYFQQRLLTNEFVCIVRRDRTDIGARLTLDEFLRESHAIVRPEGRDHLVDDFLELEGIKRNIQLEVSHFMALLPIISSSNLIATVPSGLARVCACYGNIRILPCPIDAPVVELYQFWHRRYHSDAAHKWLRSSIHTLFAGPGAG